MLFNNSHLGRLASAIIRNIFNETSLENAILPPPTDYFLLDNGGENLLDNSGDPLLTNELP